jgi:plasmid stabilization system protein ParE
MAIKYKLRQAARNDLKDIGRYTLKHHGKIQRDKYLNGFKERFVSPSHSSVNRELAMDELFRDRKRNRCSAFKQLLF